MPNEQPPAGFTYRPQIVAAWALLWTRWADLARLALPAALAMLAAPVLTAQGGQYGSLAALLLTALAMGVFGVGWIRLAGGGEGRLGLGPAQLKFAVVAKLMEGLTIVPLLAVAMMADETGTLPLPLPVPLIAYSAYQAFLVLVGMLFLILPHIALADDNTPKLPFIMAGNRTIELGLGLMLVGLPFTVASAALDVMLPEAHELRGALANQAMLVLPNILAAASTWAYLALCWQGGKEKAAATKAAA